MKPKTIFLTGSTGYIGRALLKRLLSEGYAVNALVRDVRRIPELLRAHPSLHLFEGDLDSFALLCQGAETAEAVFHLASSLRMFEKRNELHHTNVQGTKNLLRACAKTKLRIRFIFASSIEAMGPSSKESLPGDSPQPITDYGKSKLEAEEMIKTFCRAHPHLTYTIVRAGNVYDEDDGITRTVKQLSLKNGWRFSLLSHTLKDNSLALIHLEDLVDLLLLATQNPKAENKTYFAVGECLPVEKIISRMQKQGDVEPHGLTSAAPPHASSGGTLRSTPSFAKAAEDGHPRTYVRGFLRRRVMSSSCRLILAEAFLPLWNFSMRRLKRSDFLTYLSIGGPRKLRNYLDDSVFSDLQFVAQAKLGLPRKRARS